ncbi:hypothetical protein C8Q75DRAFT_283759 [Abortiporus biennis]|nr:hypothetical protein C8Q75DRAFT_283759 [Abortiporus biennis]
MAISTRLEGWKLPIEICERIVDIALEITPEIFSSAGGMGDRRLTALACALVCRDWSWRARYHLAQEIIAVSPASILQERKRREQWNITSRPHLWIDAQDAPISCVPVMLSTTMTKLISLTIVVYSHNLINQKSVHLFSIARQLTTLRLVMFESRTIDSLLSFLARFPKLRRFYLEIAWIDAETKLLDSDTPNITLTHSRFKRISLSEIMISLVDGVESAAELNILTYLMRFTSSALTLTTVDISGCRPFMRLNLPTKGFVEACKSLRELTLPMHESTDNVIGGLRLNAHSELEIITFRYKPEMITLSAAVFKHISTISEVISTIESRKLHTIRFRISLPSDPNPDELDRNIAVLKGVGWDVLDEGTREQAVYRWVKEVLFDLDSGFRDGDRVLLIISSGIVQDLRSKLPYATERGLLKVGFRRREFEPMQYYIPGPGVLDDTHYY